MAHQLKSWESPRREGRNHKGRGGSAKHRQYLKRQKRLLKSLRAGIDGSAAKKHKNDRKGEVHQPLFFYAQIYEFTIC